MAFVLKHSRLASALSASRRAQPARAFGLAAARLSSGQKTVVASPQAPPAIGPYSQAVKANGFVFLSGALGLDAKGNMTATDVAGQTEQVMANLGHVLKAAGSGFDDVVKTTILLADMNDFATVNGIYAKYFKAGSYPARATYAVKGLPKNALVEIEAVAVAKK